MLQLYSLPSICLSLILCISSGDALNIGHHERYHRMLKHAPRDFRNYGRQLMTGGTAASSGFPTITPNSATNNYTFTALPTRISLVSVAPVLPASTVAAVVPETKSVTITAQGLPATTTIPMYQICELSNGQTTDCFTVQQTVVAPLCSTVLTGFFTRATVTDCSQSITFSTKYSYDLRTTTAPALRIRQAATTSTYIQSVVSYFIAPWQSIAANTPSGITILVCTISATGVEDCRSVNEVWIVRTQYIPVTMTSTISVSQNFPTAAILVFAPSQSLSVTAGQNNFVTTLVFTILIASEATVTSTVTVVSTIAASPTTPTNIVVVSGIAKSLTTADAVSGIATSPAAVYVASKIATSPAGVDVASGIATSPASVDAISALAKGPNIFLEISGVDTTLTSVDAVSVIAASPTSIAAVSATATSSTILADAISSSLSPANSPLMVGVKTATVTVGGAATTITTAMTTIMTTEPEDDNLGDEEFEDDESDDPEETTTYWSTQTVTTTIQLAYATTTITSTMRNSTVHNSTSPLTRCKSSIWLNATSSI